MATPDDIRRASVEMLHFHPRWFAHNLLPLDFFERQVQLLRKAQQHRREDDSFWDSPDAQVMEDLFWGSLEHHRHCALRTILSTRESLSEAELEHYIELCQLDEDEIMGRSALISLLSWQGLSNAQHGRLQGHPAYDNPVAQKIVWRERMRGKLLSEGLSDALFSQMVEKQDPVFERELVDSTSISRDQLEFLAEKGISRAVRNIARSRLKRRK